MSNHFDEFDDRDPESRNGSRSSQPNLHRLDGNGACANPSSGPREQEADCCSGIQRDRFELLSAYLDGEVTAVERRQVEDWLATDSCTQQLYRRLLSLRQGLQMLPIARSEQSVEQLVNQVTARVERQPRRLVWGGLAVAGLLVGAFFNALPQERFAPSLATAPTQTSGQHEAVPSEGLMIALNHPPIEIPKSTPQKLHSPVAPVR
ncbi:MAG: anti-sigma factor family protein [Elainella sp.]